jgi:hypothetical protein
MVNNAASPAMALSSVAQPSRALAMSNDKSTYRSATPSRPRSSVPVHWSVSGSTRKLGKQASPWQTTRSSGSCASRAGNSFCTLESRVAGGMFRCDGSRKPGLTAPRATTSAARANIEARRRSKGQLSTGSSWSALSRRARDGQALCSSDEESSLAGTPGRALVTRQAPRSDRIQSSTVGAERQAAASHSVRSRSPSNAIERSLDASLA